MIMNRTSSDRPWKPCTFCIFVNVAINFTAWSTPHPSDLPCSAGPAAEGTCWKALHESERIKKQQIRIIIFKFGAGIQSCLCCRESICGCTLPGALSTVSIFASSELPACFWSFFVRLFCFMSFRMSGQLLSHPKDKLALKFLLPVWNVAELFFCLFCFLDLLHPLKTTTKRKMHTPIQQMTDKPIVIILKNKNKT